MFKIESQGRDGDVFDGRWSDEYIGDENQFNTEVEAQAAIESLLAMGGEWDAPYRIVEC